MFVEKKSNLTDEFILKHDLYYKTDIESNAHFHPNLQTEKDLFKETSQKRKTLVRLRVSVFRVLFSFWVLR